MTLRNNNYVITSLPRFLASRLIALSSVASLLSTSRKTSVFVIRVKNSSKSTSPLPSWSRLRRVYFRWLRIRGIYAFFSISLTLIFHHLKWNHPQTCFAPIFHRAISKLTLNHFLISFSFRNSQFAQERLTDATFPISFPEVDDVIIMDKINDFSHYFRRQLCKSIKCKSIFSQKNHSIFPFWFFL